MSNVVISTYDRTDHTVHYDSGASVVGVARPVAGFAMSDVRPISNAPFIKGPQTRNRASQFCSHSKAQGVCR